ncbi:MULTISPECIES: type IV secretion system DNA-binding domain-containing protein [unclassified Sulfurimonas]|uniref:type IV secretion system DNA-binding domain-containing protein n=1 Tax=unclassified Sulfurimonas TaxID=2623549 RepID=UPI0025EE7171|nr:MULTISPECIES: type IV secretion system DNA-binding domain-containing protein [unclassified Sulfurimonas]
MDLILFAAALFFTIWYFDRKRMEQGFLFYRRPLLAPRGTFGSAPNPKNIIQGYKWIDYRDLKIKFKHDKNTNTVYLDNFRFFDHFVEKSKIPEGVKNKIEKETVISLDANKLTQGVCIFGATGTGKSEMYYSLITQNWYMRALIHDIKQDFIKFFYKKNRDIIYNGGLDERSHIWDFMSESPHIQQAFFTNLLSSMLGEKKDYFSQAAQKRFTDTTKAIVSIYKDESTEKKWMLFLTAIKDLIASMSSGESKSDGDVSKTMDQILEIFELSAYFIIKGKRKTFVIEDFFKRDSQAKLYLSNIEAYKPALTPIFTGFIAAFTMVHASLDSYAAKKGDYTFYLLDEYLGFLNYLDKDTVDRIHLRLRSYGCCPISGLQKLPEKQELKDTILSSNYLLMYFGGSGKDVVDSLSDKLGKTEYWYEEENLSVDHKKNKNRSYSKQQKSMTLFSNDMMHGLGESYSHISFFPLLTTIYRGYTPQIPLKQIAEDIVATNIDEFYKLKYKDFTVREVSSFEEIFETQKKLSKIEEYKLWKKFQKTAENKKPSDDDLAKFKKENKLEEVDLELLFKKYILDKQILDNKMKLFSLNERVELNGKWQKIQGDPEQELKFIEEHNLFGALPGFFDFKTNSGEIDFDAENWE